MLKQIFSSLFFLAIICTAGNLSDAQISSVASNGRSARRFDGSGSHFKGYQFPKGKLDPVVTTKFGQLEGYVMKTVEGRSIYAFEGVPYAETTGGRNRFELPVPKAPWSGIRPAKAPGPYCIQAYPNRLFPVTGSEDCLFLNIYVPSAPILRGNGSLPVIVWIHGGSLYYGAGSEYGPAHLLEHEVILVTMNYRLGILGFLTTRDEHMPGNLGLKDQRAALKWIHENIVSFGGDPARVTLIGLSAGGVSVHFQMLSNSSQNYFRAAISMSGNAFCPFPLMTEDMTNAQNQLIASATNCPLTTSREFVDCLRKIDARDLALAYRALFEYPGLPTEPLGLVIEPDHHGAIVTEHPDATYARGGVPKIPFIVSKTADEAPFKFPFIERAQEVYSRVIPSSSRRQTLRSGFKRYLAHLLLDLKYKYNAEDISEIATKALDFYMGTGNFNLTLLGGMISDRLLGFGVHKSLQVHSQVAPTYGYVFDYHGRNSGVARALRVVDPKNVGVGHSDDIPNILNMTIDRAKTFKPSDPEYSVVKLMTSLWYNFAVNRDPQYTDDSGNEQRIWTSVKDPEHIEILQITNNEVKMIPEPNLQNMKFWESLELWDMPPYKKTEL